jgi:hypothetical protein
LWKAFGLCVLTWIPLAALDGPLRNELLPAGILSFELVATSARAKLALASWDESARSFALWSLIVDYAFMIGYAWWLSRLCWYGGEGYRSRSPIVYGWARAAAGAVWFAALCDGVENAALFVVLLETPEQPWPAIAAIMATIKFACLMGALFYASTGVLVQMMPVESDAVRGPERGSAAPRRD